MKRKQEIIRNLVLSLVFFIVIFNVMGLYLSSNAAYEASEKNNHYGPSTMVHSEEYDNGDYYLSQYKDWCSLGSSQKFLGVFWQEGHNLAVFENNIEYPIISRWSLNSSGDKEYYVLFGIINDPEVVRIELIFNYGLNTETKVAINEFHDDMFLYHVSYDRVNDLVDAGDIDLQGGEHRDVINVADVYIDTFNKDKAVTHYDQYGNLRE